jgi:hypothetical protein
MKSRNVIAQCKKPTRKWHIWILPTHHPTLKKPKEPFFLPTLDRKQIKMNRDSKIVRNFVRVRKTVRNYGNN